MWKLRHGHPHILSAQKLFARHARHLGGFSALAPRSLDSILKLNTVVHASPEEVVSLWNKYHSGRGLVSAVIRTKQFNTLQHRAKICPSFVIPLQQKDGYTSFFLQAQMPHLLFTGLEDYKKRGTNASPYLTVAHYPELADSKGLVLVRGDIIFPSKLSDVEAKQLLEVSHSFFLHDARFRLVEQFNKDSQDFDFQDVLKELNLPLGT